MHSARTDALDAHVAQQALLFSTVRYTICAGCRSSTTDWIDTIDQHIHATTDCATVRGQTSFLSRSLYRCIIYSIEILNRHVAYCCLLRIMCVSIALEKSKCELVMNLWGGIIRADHWIPSLIDSLWSSPEGWAACHYQRLQNINNSEAISMRSLKVVTPMLLRATCELNLRQSTCN